MSLLTSSCPIRITFNTLAIRQCFDEGVVGVRFQVGDGRIFFSPTTAIVADTIPIIARSAYDGKHIGRQLFIEGLIAEYLTLALDHVDLFAHPFFLVKDGIEGNFELEHYNYLETPRRLPNVRVWFSETNDRRARRKSFTPPRRSIIKPMIVRKVGWLM